MKQTAASMHKECKQTVTSALINVTKLCLCLLGAHVAHKCAYDHNRVKNTILLDCSCLNAES